MASGTMKHENQAGGPWSDGIAPATVQINRPVREGESLACCCGNDGRFTEMTSMTWDVDSRGNKIAKFSEEVRYWCPRCRSEVRPSKQ